MSILKYMEVFERYQVPSRLIEFELMESISLDDCERILRIVSSLKRKGFACLLDDFGSGYSSFHVLSYVNLDVLKIERQFFVRDFNRQNCLIIESIIKVAKLSI